MDQRLDASVTSSTSPSADTNRRASVFYAGIAVFLISRLLLLFPDAYTQIADEWGSSETAVGLINLAFLGAAGIVVVLFRQRRPSLAGTILACMVLVESALFLLGDEWSAPRGLMGLSISIAIASLLLNRRYTAVITTAAIGITLLAALRDFDDLSTGLQTERAITLAGVIIWLAALGVLGLLADSTRSTNRVALHSGTIQHLTEIGDSIARTLFERQELDMFLMHTATSIEQCFNTIVDHVNLYTIEPDSQYVVLRASTGPTGERLLAQEEKIEIGGLTVVGHATRTGEAFLVPDLTHNTIYSPHDLLPKTRSELAIPLVINNEIIGALDVQSSHPNAFDAETVSLLRAIALQVTMAVDGLRLHESVERSMRENQALNEQTQASLREIRRLNYLLTGRAWADYIRQQADAAAMTLEFEDERTQTHPEADWTPSLDRAASEHRVITTHADGRHVIALPIMVRDEVIGAMEFELDPDSDISDSNLELISAVGQRLGLAMENRRLFDETQRVAQREALINDIGAQLQSATGVDAIIQHAAHHLQESLAAQRVTIRIGVQPDAEQSRQETTRA
jgi:GAF domain-containing protein